MIGRGVGIGAAIAVGAGVDVRPAPARNSWRSLAAIRTCSSVGPFASRSLPTSSMKGVNQR